MAHNLALRRWSLVIPVKPLALAKSRLAPVGATGREDLALAFACDAVRAAVECASVRDVVVVTDDHAVAACVRELGAVVVADGPAAGLNAALLHGAQHADRSCPDRPVAALTADLPALRAEDLSRALRQAAAHDTAFVRDEPGTGTTLLAAGRLALFAPAFGAGSARAHEAAGAVEVGAALARLRRDVDTRDDLAAALTLGVGTRTAQATLALRRLG